MMAQKGGQAWAFDPHWKLVLGGGWQQAGRLYHCFDSPGELMVSGDGRPPARAARPFGGPP
jgi:hypothetical protein